MLTVEEMIQTAASHVEERLMEFFITPKSELECVEVLGDELNFRVALVFIKKLIDEQKLEILANGKLVSHLPQ